MKQLVRSRWLFILLWFGAIGFGALGVSGTRGYISEQLARERASLADADRRQAVVVAAVDLPAGSLVNAQVTASREMPVSFLSPLAIEADNFASINGSRLRVAVRRGQPLTRDYMVAAQSQHLSDQVRPGIRAMTVEVDDVNSVSGMLVPGDRIDLLYSAHAPAVASGISGDMAAPLMQNLVVLATGRQRSGSTPDNRQTGFNTITVEVRPDQAKKLVLAQRTGRLTALLRNPADDDALNERMIALEDLLGKPALRRSPTPRPRVIVGGLGPLDPKRFAVDASLTATPLQADSGAEHVR